MKTIIAGSRNIFKISLIFKIIETCPWKITEVVTGDGGNVDFLGAYWGYLNEIIVKHFPARWEYLGRRAGMARNQVMADYAEALIYVWDGKSRGTRDMISRASRYRFPIWPSPNPDGSFRAWYDPLPQQHPHPSTSSD